MKENMKIRAVNFYKLAYGKSEKSDGIICRSQIYSTQSSCEKWD